MGWKSHWKNDIYSVINFATVDYRLQQINIKYNSRFDLRLKSSDRNNEAARQI
jgi:hypothetical protein